MSRQLRGAYELGAMYASDYCLRTLYDRANVTGATPGTIDLGRAGVRVDASSIAIDIPIKSVWVSAGNTVLQQVT